MLPHKCCFLTLSVLFYVARVNCTTASDTSKDPWPLGDFPIASAAGPAIYLDKTSSWRWTSANGASFPAAVPGDLITDMQVAGLIGDPLLALNFKSTAWDDTFTLHAEFAVDPVEMATSAHFLMVMDGVKMGANIYLNDRLLGSISNQFLRFTYDVSSLLLPKNHLRVVFPPSNSSINAASRWMACSGAWDWAPYGSTFSPAGSHTFSKGLWKSVYLLPIDIDSDASAAAATATATATAIAAVAVQTFYLGPYPLESLQDSQAGAWRVSVNVSLSTSAAQKAAEGRLSVHGDWAPEEVFSVEVERGQGYAIVEMRVAAGSVRLWWPNGARPSNGASTSAAHAAHMYTLHVTYSSAHGQASAKRRLGFRTAYLLTAPLTAYTSTPHEYQSVVRDDATDGSGDFTMRFIVNGLSLWARGANFIPVDEMEGRVRVETYSALLRSAAAANLNMLRVWGGGVYQYEPFYSLCDELGIMVWQDLMYGYPWFGGNSGVPTPGAEQEEEIRSNMQRLSPHPSIVLWNGCNECDPAVMAGMASFVLPLMAQTDPSRAVWPASPSTGWLSGVSALTGLPNGRRLQAKPIYSSSSTQKYSFAAPAGCSAARWAIETHGPYQHGEGFQTVNSGGALQPFDPNLPPRLDAPAELGDRCPGTFGSEFGASAWSSFESVSPTLDPADWGMHAAPMRERNYAADNFLVAYFPYDWPGGDLNATGEAPLRAALYYAQLGQALQQKSDISQRRSRNSVGTLSWQLNEIWPTGGWGSVEYGSVGFTPGQVVGGRWKPLHYWLQSHLFTDLFVSCGTDAMCVVKNDGAQAFAGHLKLSVLHLASGKVEALSDTAVALSPCGGGSAAKFVCAGGSKGKGKGRESGTGCAGWAAVLQSAGGCTAHTCVLLTALLRGERDGAQAEAQAYSSFELLAPPRNLTLPQTTVSLYVHPPRAGGEIPISVRADRVALFVGLSTQAQGHFDRNFFILLPGGGVEVLFVPRGGGQQEEALLRATLRAAHVGMATM